jgi:hypothetical protein
MLRTIAVLLVAMLACSDSPVAAPSSEPDAPIVPPTTPAPTVGANYVIALVNGAPLPSESPIGAGQWDYDGAQYNLVFAMLALYADGTLSETWTHRRTPGGDEITQSFSGRYTRISDSILQIGAGAGATFVTLSATGLVWQLPGFKLTYELQK